MTVKYAILFLFFMFQFSGTAQEKFSISNDIHYDGPQVFPNPAIDYITVLYGYPLSDTSGVQGLWLEFEMDGFVNIFSSDGKHIQQNISLNKESYKTDIPVEELTKGVYFIVIQLDDEEPIVKKIVKT